MSGLVRVLAVLPVGAAPGAFTAGSSFVYGTGAFLMAGSEGAITSHTTQVKDTSPSLHRKAESRQKSGPSAMLRRRRGLV